MTLVNCTVISSGNKIVYCRRFYAHSSSESLKQLYVSFVRPHLEYAAPVWDPHCITHISALERVQKFSLRMSYKAWDEEYDNLLSRANLQPLAKRRKFLKVMHATFIRL